MKKAYRDLVKFAIKDMGFFVSVWDGEEWAVKVSDKQKDIFEAIESVEEAELVFSDGNLNRKGWARVADAYPDEPECTVIDHTVNEWLEKWSEQYDRTIGA